MPEVYLFALLQLAILPRFLVFELHCEGVNTLAVPQGLVNERNSVAVRELTLFDRVIESLE